MTSIFDTTVLLFAKAKNIRLYSVCVFMFFLALCVSQYGNEFVVTFPLNISQLLMIAGFLLLLLEEDRVRVPTISILIFGFIGFVSFVINFDSVRMLSQLKMIAGMLCYFVFTYSVLWNSRQDLWGVMRIYYKIAIVYAGFAILQVVVWVVTGYALVEPVLRAQLGGFLNFRPEAFGLLPRAISFHREPSHLVVFLLPALYFSVMRLFRHKEFMPRVSIWSAWVVVIGFVLTFSLNAYVGLFAIFLSAYYQKNSHNKVKVFFGALLGSALLLGAGLSVESLRERMLQLVSFNVTDLDTNNLSTFAFLSNGLVSYQSVVQSYGLGFGIDTHPESYDRFLGHYFSAFQVVMRLNTEDAASLYFHILSEFGVFGILGFLLLVLRHKCRDNGFLEQMNRMAGIVVLVVAIRNGGYMNQVTWMGICLLLVTFESGGGDAIKSATSKFSFIKQPL